MNLREGQVQTHNSSAVYHIKVKRAHQALVTISLEVASIPHPARLSPALPPLRVAKEVKDRSLLNNALLCDCVSPTSHFRSCARVSGLQTGSSKASMLHVGLVTGCPALAAITTTCLSDLGLLLLHDTWVRDTKCTDGA